MSLAQSIFQDKIAKKLTANAEKVKAIKAIYAFDITDEGSTWLIDLTKDSDFVSEGIADKANCTVSIKATDLNDIVEKKLNPQMAFMTGKLKVKGDMGLALKLGTIL